MSATPAAVLFTRNIPGYDIVNIPALLHRAGLLVVVMIRQRGAGACTYEDVHIMVIHRLPLGIPTNKGRDRAIGRHIQAALFTAMVDDDTS